LLGSVLVGFGLWHVVDAVLSHWLLGIHRIKLDSPNPLAWDLVWLAGLVLLPFAAGWLLLRRSEKAQPGRGSTVGPLVAGLVASGMAAASAIPPPEQKFTTVVFAPGVKPAGVMNAIVATEGRLVWADPAMGVVVVDALPMPAGTSTPTGLCWSAAPPSRAAASTGARPSSDSAGRTTISLHGALVCG